MKINFVAYDDPSWEGRLGIYRKFIKNLTKRFAEEYDIPEYDAGHYCHFTDSGREEFVNWLTRSRILTVKTFCLTDDNGKKIAVGIDINEDAYFTKALIEFS